MAYILCNDAKNRLKKCLLEKVALMFKNLPSDKRVKFVSDL